MWQVLYQALFRLNFTQELQKYFKVNHYHPHFIIREIKLGEA